MGQIERHCTLCLLRELEVEPWLKTLKTPDLELEIHPAHGTLRIALKGNKPLVVDALQKIEKRFPTFFLGARSLEEAIQQEMVERKKTLALAESCTGGSIAAHLVSVPHASLFFLGSIVAYSNSWKERFLRVRRDTLKKQGAVSREAVMEMVEGLFGETDADYAIAVSGWLGPFVPDSKGTVFIGIGKRGEAIDIGSCTVPSDRAVGMELSVQTAIGALWRRVVHNTFTFS